MESISVYFVPKAGIKDNPFINFLSYEGIINIEENQIRLNIKVDFDTGREFGIWFQSHRTIKIGELLSVKLTENKNLDLINIDISNSDLERFTYTTNLTDIDGNLSISIDRIKLYCKRNTEYIGQSFYYLDDNSFKLVEPYYLPLSRKNFFIDNGKFKLPRIKGKDKKYNYLKCKFWFDFQTTINDRNIEKTAQIHKHPRLILNFPSELDESDIEHFTDIILNLASFYHHTDINYKYSRTYLKNYTIKIHKTQSKLCSQSSFDLSSFGHYGDLDDLYRANWQTSLEQNFKLLDRVINLFNQAVKVDDISGFLIRYSLIEVCDTYSKSKKFTYTKSKKQISYLYDEALKKLLIGIKEDEHLQFTTRWKSIRNILEQKPMKNQLESFLCKQGIDISNLPINISRLKQIRNCLVHGSVETIDSLELKKANVLLYRITGILILNLLNIKDWNLDTNIK